MFCGCSLWFMMFVMVGDVLWLFMVIWEGFVMVCDCFFSPKVSNKRSCHPLLNQSETQIHYEISFLMRLYICPLQFKEHTLKSSARNQLNCNLIEIIKFSLYILDYMESTSPMGGWMGGWMDGHFDIFVLFTFYLQFYFSLCMLYLLLVTIINDKRFVINYFHYSY